MTLSARCTEGIRKRPGRTEFQRGIVERAADGGQLGWPVGSEGDRAEFAKFVDNDFASLRATMVRAGMV